MSIPPTSGPESGLAPVWRSRFAFFDRYGLPNGTDEARAALRAMPFGQRLRLNSNILAFLFGPIYFFVKGMWRKGVTLLVAGIVVIAVLSAVGASDSIVRAVSFGVSAAAMLTANFAYYLHVRRGSTSWNPFEGFGRR